MSELQACRDVLWAAAVLSSRDETRLPGRGRINEFLKRTHKHVPYEPDPWKTAMRYFKRMNYVILTPCASTHILDGTIDTLHDRVFGEGLSTVVQIRCSDGTSAFVKLEGGALDAALRLARMGIRTVPAECTKVAQHGVEAIRDELRVVFECLSARRHLPEQDATLVISENAASDLVVDALAIGAIVMEGGCRPP